MPRRARVAPGGLVFQLLNPAVARLLLFQEPNDFEPFERVLALDTRLVFSANLTRNIFRCFECGAAGNHLHLWVLVSLQLAKKRASSKRPGISQ